MINMEISELGKIYTKLYKRDKDYLLYLMNYNCVELN